MTPPPAVVDFTGLLDNLVNHTSGEEVSVGELLDAVGRRAFGPVILLLGFIALTPLTLVPGATWLIAGVTFVFCLQIVLGRQRPWLPARLVQARFPRKFLVQAVDSTRKSAAVADALARPRLVFLTASPFIQIAALACCGAAAITFPLGFVPLAPMLPGLAILLFGVALTARDGAVLLLAAFCLAGAVVVLARLAL